MDSKNITDTDARVFQAVSAIAQNVYDNQNVETKIDKAVSESMVTSGYMTKFYPYLNKCEVKLDSNGKLVLCNLLSLFSGDMLSLYTPSGDESFCEKLKEPCIIPRGKLPVLVANINSEEYDYVMLGYFFPDDLVGFNPSAPSNFKILASSPVSEYSLRFGVDGLKIVNNGEIGFTALNDYDEDVTVGYYNKNEIDKTVEELEEEIKTHGGVDVVTEWETSLSDEKVPSEKLVKDTIDTKQDVLVSGESIKTINNQSLLGSGNINVSGGGDLSEYVRKDEFLDLFDVDFNYTWGNPLLNNDYISIDLFLKEK